VPILNLLPIQITEAEELVVNNSNSSNISNTMIELNALIVKESSLIMLLKDTFHTVQINKRKLLLRTEEQETLSLLVLEDEYLNFIN
jgi:hypothetical protein